jgi:hypothetical protein
MMESPRKKAKFNDDDNDAKMSPVYTTSTQTPTHTLTCWDDPVHGVWGMSYKCNFYSYQP